MRLPGAARPPCSCPLLAFDFRFPTMNGGARRLDSRVDSTAAQDEPDWKNKSRCSARVCGWCWGMGGVVCLGEMEVKAARACASIGGETPSTGDGKCHYLPLSAGTQCFPRFTIFSSQQRYQSNACHLLSRHKRANARHGLLPRRSIIIFDARVSCAVLHPPQSSARAFHTLSNSAQGI